MTRLRSGIARNLEAQRCNSQHPTVRSAWEHMFLLAYPKYILDAVRAFWATQVGVPPDEIRLLRKSNSGRLAGRTWRSEHGVLTVWCNDTRLRARMQAWMDVLRAEWLTLIDPGA
jgi:hypothetical protein